MTRCIIHIGMHKTGSTSIQSSLQGFEDDKFLYANLGKAANHSVAIYSAFAAHPDRHQQHRAKKRTPEAVQAYIAEVLLGLERSVLAARGRTLIISGEDIGVLPRDSLLKLSDYFRGKVDEVKVVGYVRPPAAFIASSFQERVKNGTIGRFDVERMYRGYQKNFGSFDEVFGRENVHLWKFEPAKFPDGCVVQDFCSRLDISLPVNRIIRLNESLSRQAVAFLYTYGKFCERYGSKKLKGGESMKLGMLLGAGGRKFRFSPDLMRPVLEKNRADIEWMEDRLGQPLREELGEHQPGDVRDEEDLLRVDVDVTRRLLDLLGSKAPKGIRGETPEEVALLVHVLRGGSIPELGAGKGPEQKAGRAQPRPSNGQVPIMQLIDEVQQKNPAAINGISREEARKLVRMLFKHMNETLVDAQDGVINYAGLGRFRVMNVERDVEGKRVMAKRIAFQPARQPEPQTPTAKS